MTKPPVPVDKMEYLEWLEENLNPQEAADFLGVTAEWLQRGRCNGFGPKFRLLSPRQISYVRKDLLEYRDSRTHSSTSEYRAQSADASTETGSESTESSGDES